MLLAAFDVMNMIGAVGGPLAVCLTIAVLALWNSKRAQELQHAKEREAWSKERGALIIEREQIKAGKSEAAAAIRAECAAQIKGVTDKYERIMSRFLDIKESKSD